MVNFLNKSIMIFFITFLNIYIFLYIFKIYSFNYENDRLRFAIILVLGLFFLIGNLRYIFIKFKVNKIYCIFLLYFIYIGLSLLFRGNIDSSAFLSSLYFPLTFLASYSFFDKRKKNHLNLIIYFQFFILIILFLIYFISLIILNIKSGLVINTIYFQTFLLPFILILSNKKIRIIGILLIIISSIISLKRTAIFSLILTLMYFYRDKRTKKNTINKIIKIMLIIFMFLFSFFIIKYCFDLYYIEELSNRLVLIFSDRGSGRLDIYRNLFSVIHKFNFEEFFVGLGFNKTTFYNNGLSAHNDFIEIFFNFGFYGLLFFIMILYYLFKYAVLFAKNNYVNASAYKSSLILFIFTILFSNVIFVQSYILYLSIFWSFCIIDYKKANR